MEKGLYHNAVMSGMRIVKVNDIEGDVMAMAEELRTAQGVVRLSIRRAEVAAKALTKMKDKLKYLSVFGRPSLKPGASSSALPTILSPGVMTSPTANSTMASTAAS